MKNFAIVLSGCGVYDGSEIHEAVTTMLAIKQLHANYQIFSPNINQAHVVNHLTGEVTDETRNVLVESARIARGDVKDLKEYDPSLFDGIIFPGGFGVAKNFCDYAFNKTKCTVNPEIIDAIQKTVNSGKLIGAECISPVMMAAVLKGATVTIGNDSSTSSDIQALNGHHVNTKHNDVIYDDHYKLFTTPCYMLAKDIQQVWESSYALVSAMLEKCN